MTIHRPRRTIALVAGTALVVALTACSNGATQAEPDTNELSGEIRFTTWYAPEMWEAIVEKFEELHPDVTVTVQQVPNDQYYTKLQTEFASGNAPDVFGMQFQASQWGPAGILEPMTDYVADVIDTVPESLTAPGRAVVDGTEEQFALPYTFVGRSLFANLTALQEAGIEVDESWTLDDLVEAAQKLTTPERYGLYVYDGTGEAAIASTFGASPLSADGETATYDSAEMIAHKTFMRDLIYKYKVSPAPGVLSTQQDPFASGQVAMTYSGSWMIPTYRDGASFDWDILPNPSGEQEAKNYGGPDSIGVYSNSKNLDVAKAFAKFAVFDQVAQTEVSTAGYWPVVSDLFSDPELVAAQAAAKPANIEYFLEEATQNSIGWGFSPVLRDIVKMETDANYAMFSDPDSNIPAILEQLNSDVQEALDRGLQ